MPKKDPPSAFLLSEKEQKQLTAKLSEVEKEAHNTQIMGATLGDTFREVAAAQTPEQQELTRALLAKMKAAIIGDAPRPNEVVAASLTLALIASEEIFRRKPDEYKDKVVMVYLDELRQQDTPIN